MSYDPLDCMNASLSTDIENIDQLTTALGEDRVEKHVTTDNVRSCSIGSFSENMSDMTSQAVKVNS